MVERGAGEQRQGMASRAAAAHTEGRTPTADQPIECEAPPTGIVQWLETFPPDAPVILVPVADPFETAVASIERLVATLHEPVPLVILDEAGADERMRTTMAALAAGDDRVRYLRKQAASGAVHSANLIFAWGAPRDVVIVASDTLVPPGWLARLRGAAYHRTTIATATPFTNDGAFLSVPYRNQPTAHLPRGRTLAEADRRVAAASRMSYPIIPAPLGHCTYYKRSALAIAGTFDASFAPQCGAEVDFAQRAVGMGLCHVVADDLLVFSGGGRFPQFRRTEAQAAAGAAAIAQRYPWYQPWAEAAAQADHTPLAMAIERARRALVGVRLAIDARSLGETTMGTQTVTLELLNALVQRDEPDMHLTVILDDDVPHRVLHGLEGRVNAVRHTAELRHATHPVFDLLHRPCQTPSLDELAFCRRLANRVIITHLDSILFANPTYTTDPTHWARIRQAMQRAFALADGIAFLSAGAAADAAHQGLVVPTERACVTYSGVDHALLTAAATPPGQARALGDTPFILVIGSNYRHKNRPFALRLLRALVDDHAWPGSIVFAGPEVPVGGSGGEEALERLAHPALDARIHQFGPVTEGEKRWLYERAALVLYPSVVEGFGLVPFEAAAAGTPTLTTRAASLTEMLGPDVAYLDTFDAERAAPGVAHMLADAESARNQVAAIAARAAGATWSSVGARAWDFYQQILALPPRVQTVEFADDPGEDEWTFRQEVQVVRQATQAVHDEVGAFRHDARQMQEAMEQVQRAATILRREYTTVCNWATQIQEAEADLRHEYGMVRTWAVTLQQENTDLRREYDTVCAWATTLREAEAELRAEYERMRAWAIGLQQETADQQRENETLRGRAAALLRESAELRRDDERARARAATLDRELRAAARLLGEAREQSDGARRECARLATEMLALHGEHDQLRAWATTLNDALTRVQQRPTIVRRAIARIGRLLRGQRPMEPPARSRNDRSSTAP